MSSTIDISLVLQAGLKTEFMTAMASYTPMIAPMISTKVPSTKRSETYGWLGDTPQMKEWVSERTPKKLRENGFTIINKDYESTIEIDRNDLEDDQYQQHKIRVQGMGQNAQKFYDRRVTEIVEAGTTETCYDGQFFFDTDHQEGISDTQSNAPAAASTYSIFDAEDAREVYKLVNAAMPVFKTDTNELAGIRVTHVMVPTALGPVFREAFDPAFRGGGETSETNWAKGRVQVIENPYQTVDTTNTAYSAIYWLDLSQPVKPFIWQNRKDPEFVALDKPESRDLFFSKKLYYGVDLRCNFGYGDWRMAYRTKGAA